MQRRVVVKYIITDKGITHRISNDEYFVSKKSFQMSKTLQQHSSQGRPKHTESNSLHILLIKIIGYHEH